jgi:RimJ/RimL family protein N-acetyltransferase
MPLETALLLLRPPRPTDAPSLFEFLGDAAAMQYTTHQTSMRPERFVPDMQRFFVQRDLRDA